MKRRTSRDINIFNMSMLDVICSALGAFVILILMADFNRSDAVQTVKKLQDEIRHYSKSNKELRRSAKAQEGNDEKNKELKKENAALKQKVERLESEVAQNESKDANEKQTRDQLARCEEENRALKREVASLKEKVGSGKGSRRDQFTVYGRWDLRVPKVVIAGTKVTRRTRHGNCYKNLYTCKLSSRSQEICESPTGTLGKGGGGGQ
jgi:cell shape-determining protein MreC